MSIFFKNKHNLLLFHLCMLQIIASINYGNSQEIVSKEKGNIYLMLPQEHDNEERDYKMKNLNTSELDERKSTIATKSNLEGEHMNPVNSIIVLSNETSQTKIYQNNSFAYQSYTENYSYRRADITESAIGILFTPNENQNKMDENNPSEKTKPTISSSDIQSSTVSQLRYYDELEDHVSKMFLNYTKFFSDYVHKWTSIHKFYDKNVSVSNTTRELSNIKSTNHRIDTTYQPHLRNENKMHPDSDRNNKNSSFDNILRETSEKTKQTVSSFDLQNSTVSQLQYYDELEDNVSKMFRNYTKFLTDSVHNSTSIHKFYTKNTSVMNTTPELNYAKFSNHGIDTTYLPYLRNENKMHPDSDSNNKNSSFDNDLRETSEKTKQTISSFDVQNSTVSQLRIYDELEDNVSKMFLNYTNILTDSVHESTSIHKLYNENTSVMNTTPEINYIKSSNHRIDNTYQPHLSNKNKIHPDIDRSNKNKSFENDLSENTNDVAEILEQLTGIFTVNSIESDNYFNNIKIGVTNTTHALNNIKPLNNKINTSYQPYLRNENHTHLYSAHNIHNNSSEYELSENQNDVEEILQGLNKMFTSNISSTDINNGSDYNNNNVIIHTNNTSHEFNHVESLGNKIKATHQPYLSNENQSHVNSVRNKNNSFENDLSESKNDVEELLEELTEIFVPNSRSIAIGDENNNDKDDFLKIFYSEEQEKSSFLTTVNQSVLRSMQDIVEDYYDTSNYNNKELRIN